ncbi:MAG: hypothetical protein SFU27_00740 [Thermonemataceae bacterium]|nr:hypothetical protein [Thermonemataceae bacterium]
MILSLPVLAQHTPFPLADSICTYQVNNGDTLKKELLKREIFIYDKKGMLRERLVEEKINGKWTYTQRVLLGYNAINRIQHIKKEIWNTEKRNWQTNIRRTFNYNVRYLPVSYLDEKRVAEAYQKIGKVNFEYTNKHQLNMVVCKVFKQNQWKDSLKKTLFYDSTNSLKSLLTYKNEENFWFLSEKTEKNLKKQEIEFIYKSINATGRDNIKEKISEYYSKKGDFLGYKRFSYDEISRKYKETGGLRAWYDKKSAKWNYNFYVFKEGKMWVESQISVSPSKEAKNNAIKDLPIDFLE